MGDEVFLFLGGYVLLIILVLIIPIVATVILGTYLANYLGLSGIIWWAFVIVFFCVVSGLMNSVRS